LVMGLCDRAHAGLFIALWGITQALAQGIGTISAGLARDVIGRMSGVVANGYIAVYLSALTLIAVASAILLILSWRGQLRAEQVRSPWSSLDQVNADQIIF
ncbi:MAG: MFS transporter, partial [Chloroflexus aggregans]